MQQAAQWNNNTASVHGFPVKNFLPLHLHIQITVSPKKGCSMYWHPVRLLIKTIRKWWKLYKAVCRKKYVAALTQAANLFLPVR